MDTKKNQKSPGQRLKSKYWQGLFLTGLVFFSLIQIWNPAFEGLESMFGISKENELVAAEKVGFVTSDVKANPTTQKPFPDADRRLDQPAGKAVKVSETPRRSWREALQELVAVGHAGTDPSTAIFELLTAEPGMGDRLLFSLLEMEASQNERDALLVALATALSFDPETDTVGGVEGVRWPDGLESLWHDRSGTILWMAELWIDGDPHSKYFERLLQLPEVLLPWHSLELVRLLEKQTNSLDSQAQSRFQHLLEISLRRENPDSLIVTREWIDASNPILRKVALRTIGRSLAMDPIGARTFLESIHQGERISVLESLFSRVQGENLPEMIHQTADLMLEQEYRGSALLSSFSRGTQLDLETLVYQRGAEESSENYRNLVLYASQGGIDRGGEITSLWANNLDRIARTDPSRSVRCTALRVRALSWPLSDIGGFVQLIQRSDVDPRTAEIAHALMMARQSTR